LTTHEGARFRHGAPALFRRMLGRGCAPGGHGMRPIFCWLGCVALLSLGGAVGAQGQEAAPAQEQAAPPVFGADELEQIVAPIALYPDSLLAQVFMASTYPLEIVEAERWQKANPDLKDQALQDALQSQ